MDQSPPDKVQEAVPARRYEGLDQLRGILAFSVMIYHYTEWHGFILPWVFQKPLELLGIYAVCTFYSLSGCALFIVYHNRKINNGLLKEFWIKRTFRIVPLFWLATLLVIVTQKSSSISWHEYLDPWRMFLNFSLLFSWIEPGAYYATGAWSIGNEWAFYTMFPLILWGSRRKSTLVLLCAATAAASCWYAFSVLTPHKSISDQWGHYIHPLNQVILFVLGVLIGPLVISAKPHSQLPVRTYVSVGCFIAISYIATIPDCITGFGRLILVGICICCCESFAVTRLNAGVLSRILTFLGTISYTLYLMHPIVHHGVSKILGKIQSIVGTGVLGKDILSFSTFCGSILATIFISSLIYWRLEKPAIRLGQRAARKFSFV
jgi:exopolysaccharide production protein ExoZ